MAISEQFGPILSATTIQNATKATLEEWFHTYLAEVERQVGIDACSTQRPLSYSHVTRFSRPFLEEQIPSLVIISPGISEKPRRFGSGTYRARWGLSVAPIVSAGGEEEREATEAMAKLYAAAVRACLLQKRVDLDGFVGITWEDEDYTDLPTYLSRSMGVSSVVFTLEFDDTVNDYGGPATVPDDPCGAPPDFPEIATHSESVTIIS